LLKKDEFEELLRKKTSYNSNCQAYSRNSTRIPPLLCRRADEKAEVYHPTRDYHGGSTQEKRIVGGELSTADTGFQLVPVHYHQDCGYDRCHSED
jgi:hypothetical protein